jgi:H+/Cl- antiporter ClcA
MKKLYPILAAMICGYVVSRYLPLLPFSFGITSIRILEAEEWVISSLTGVITAFVAVYVYKKIQGIYKTKIIFPILIGAIVWVGLNMISGPLLFTGAYYMHGYNFIFYTWFGYGVELLIFFLTAYTSIYYFKRSN